MPRVLLIAPTSNYRISDFIAAAESLGVEVAVAAEEDLPLLGVDRFVRIDCSDHEAAATTVADLAAVTPIDAIVPVDEAGVVIAALASKMLGLSHNSPAAAAATRNKAVMRRALGDAEVPQPRFALVHGSDGADAAVEIGYPLVAKPLTLSGSRGVVRVDNPEDLTRTLERIRGIASEAGEEDRGVLLESFVTGPEVAVEGMLWDGELEMLAIFDKPEPLDGPYFEETIYVTPSALDEPLQTEIARVTQAAVSAIGLGEGPIHAELRIPDRKPSVIELAGRSIGGMCGRALSFGLLDTSLETLILRHALGRPRRGLRRNPRASGVMMIPIPSQGTLTAVDGIDRARQVEGVSSLQITTPIGARLRPVPESDRYLGFIFAQGRDRSDVIAALKEAHNRLEIVIR